MAAPSTPDEIRDVNARYHDGAAADYDAKWGIDWGEVGRRMGRTPGAARMLWVRALTRFRPLCEGRL